MIAMDALLVHYGTETAMEQKWGKMFILSFCLHLVIFSTVLFFPQPLQTRKTREVVYEVNLVEMPRGKKTSFQASTKADKVKAVSAPAKATPAKRIGTAQKQAKPVILAKRTVKPQAQKIKPPEESSTKRIGEVLARIEKKVEAEEKSAKLVNKPIVSDEGSLPGAAAENGITILLYKLEIYERIKGNWSYVSLLGPDNKKDFIAIVELQVKRDGTVLKTKVTRSSGNAQFDESVLKAIKRSTPLPPFPEGYRKTYDEIEINFNLSDLKSY